MMINMNRKITTYQWWIATLAIVSIFLIILDFAAVIDINIPTSKWFWINDGIGV